jgi:hypothetical protein
MSSTLEPMLFYNNINRYNKYKKIINYLSEIKLDNNQCLELTDKSNQYLLSKNIALYKQIGTESVYGVVFKAQNINDKYKGIPKFTVKLQLDSSILRTELDITSKLSKFGLIRKIPNLPIIYKIIDCYDIPYDYRYPSIITKNYKNKTKYTMIINELASGDLNSFMSEKYSFKLTDELWRNTYEQIFISILILHYKKIRHNDTHDGNFLYHKIKPGGCFHYNINGIDYYIKNMGFLWTSWDYGLVTKLKTKGEYVYDYMEIIATMRKNDISKITDEYRNHNFYYNYEWGYLPKFVNVPASIIKLQMQLFELLGGYNNNNHIYQIEQLKLSEDLFFKTLLNEGILFSSKPKGKIISSVKLTLPIINDIK